MTSVRLCNPITGTVRVSVQTGYDLRDARLRELRAQIAALSAPADMQRIEAQR